MEPLFPGAGLSSGPTLAFGLREAAAALSGRLHPLTQGAVGDLVRQMNSYYSNLIEGHATHPLDIERALRSEFAEAPTQRALQLEHRAHIQVQERIEERLATDPTTAVCSSEFICWIHEQFYERMPDEFRWVADARASGRIEVVPGRLRSSEVVVGAHVAPAHDALEKFLRRFEEAYAPERLNPLDQVIALAASHHRLAWIHPFIDGNGRVVRLFTHAYRLRIGLAAGRLWTVTRGLARRKEDYFLRLADADQPRRGDLDGRGNLSQSALASFCEFFLTCALDQIQFMSKLLELDGFMDRILGFADRQAALKLLPQSAGHLLRDVMLRGSVPRGEAGRILGLSTSGARAVVSQLVRQRLLTSETPKSPLRLGLPIDAVGYYFPRLYPEGTELPPPGSSEREHIV